ncbi:heme-copper oxidase subunit III [Sphaerisporangium sp. TRM90804]|uniref:aa3-type cytochrome oxidase subunit III n=1 Tax=Sphaerisporangium sp. TRM90804 TaxID=3031113 RepID=UPI00244935DF|nr:heme-copper oxidase subunit III [Sphaerisporangium sp. TRM90804]MDH2424566.1 heme-copper oxidase subunit III [Sphaerisporangium sp. TRM90804]
MLRVATASAITTTAHSSRRPNLVSVGTIVWLSSELMFFAALFAMYFTIRSVTLGQGNPWPTLPEGAHLDVPYALVNTIVLVLSSVTCQLGVWAAEKGQVQKLRFWYIVSFLMGAWFVGGQVYEYSVLMGEGLSLSTNAYGSVFYLTTGFHGLHVTGGLIAFLFMLGRTYAAKRFTHEQATSAIVVSYYWHFVDVVWIGLFATIYIIK